MKTKDTYRNKVVADTRPFFHWFFETTLRQQKRTTVFFFFLWGVWQDKRLRRGVRQAVPGWILWAQRHNLVVFQLL
jgi:hypothetical protein